MPASENLDQRLDKARDTTLAETNAQAIFENLRKLREFRAVHRRRWIWELLQNAADATDPSKGPNRVSIHSEPTSIRFSHNGSPFSPEEISHLIYHGSTKQEAATRFGTGFLAVHLVSPTVRICGILKDNGLSRGFKFLLDRSGDTASAIQRNMGAAWASFKGELCDTDGTVEFTTTFECDLDSEAGAVVQTGLADLAQTVPYVLAFVNKLETVEVEDESGTRTWRVAGRDPRSDITFTEVACEKVGARPEIVRIGVVGDHARSVALAVLLRQAGGRWELVTDDSTPRLFYPLPLVDTHALPVPFAIVSGSFEPTEERNGILASAAGEKAELTEKNWVLLSQVPSLFQRLVEACCREGWLAPHRLAEFRKAPPKEWLDAKRFTSEVLSKAVGGIRSNGTARLVCVAEDRVLPIAECAIPVKDPERKIHGLAAELTVTKERLPAPEVAAAWADILDGRAAVLGTTVEQFDEAWTAEKLATRIAPFPTLDTLGANLTSGTGAGAMKWLNRLLKAVPAERLPAFVRDRSILPNQQENLRKAGELRLDVRIEETIKDICEKLGDSVRSELLHKHVCMPARRLFEGERGRSLSTEDCVDRVLKRVKETPAADREQAHAEANAELLCWLIDHRLNDKLIGYPVLCVTGKSELRSDKPLLAPASLWDKGVQPFADLFSQNRRLAGQYESRLQDRHWYYLEEQGFVRRSFFAQERLDKIDRRQVEDEQSLSEETEHTPANPTTTQQIPDLSGLLDEVRRSKPKARCFLQFLLQYVIKSDRSWIQTAEVTCGCGKTHRVLPAWMLPIMTRQWVPVARGEEEKPSAKNVAALLDSNLEKTIVGDPDCAEFMLKIGIGVSELLRFNAPQEKRSQLDRLSARIYASPDPATLASIEAVLDDDRIRDAVLRQREQTLKVRRNQKVGRAVEELLRKELESAGIQVTRTGVGSDFEIESDFVENEQEQWLHARRFLMEVKSTSAPHVKMTLRQGEEAVKAENREQYVLCVVDVSGGEINEQVVREKSKFVFGVGPLVEAKLNDARSLKDLEGELRPSGTGDVVIDLEEESTVKLRISAQVWLGRGVPFQEFVGQVKEKA